MIVCRIGRCVAFNELESCAHCATFPCEDQVSGAYHAGMTEENINYHVVVLERLAQVRAGLPQDAIKPPKPLKPAKTKTVDFPDRVNLPETERQALRVVHQLLVQLITCGAAKTYVARIIAEDYRPHFLDALWQMGLYGELRVGPRPHLWAEKDHSRKLGLPMPDSPQDMSRFGGPYVVVDNVLKKSTSPRNWEIKLSLAGDHDGLDALQALQKYVRTLCEVYGKPEWKGSHRYAGKAYEYFSTADMTVFSGGG